MLPWGGSFATWSKSAILAQIKEQDWCQTCTTTSCHLLPMIISFFFPGNVNLSAVTPVPLTWMSCHLLYLAWKYSFSYHYLSALSISNCVLFFFSWNHDWVLLWQFGLKMLSGGKIINMDQYSLTCAMSQVASLHFYPIHLSSITEFCRRLCFKISVGMIFFFFLRATILSWLSSD